MTTPALKAVIPATGSNAPLRGDDVVYRRTTLNMSSAIFSTNKKAPQGLFRFEPCLNQKLYFAPIVHTFGLAPKSLLLP